MNKSLELRIFNYFPNVSKIRKNNYSQQDYISVLFEASFNEDPIVKKTKIKPVETNAFFVFYLLLDYHENEMNISFDMLEVEKTDSYYLCDIKTQPILKTKEFITQDTDKIKYKPSKVNTNIDSSLNFKDLMNQFFLQDIEPITLSIQQFLDQNFISYNQKKLDEHLKLYLLNAQQFFSENHLKPFLTFQINKFNSEQLFEKLENNLNLNEQVIKKNKI